MVDQILKEDSKSIVSRFGRRISKGQVNYLRAGHLDIIEENRRGIRFRESGSRHAFIDAFSSAGCFNVGRSNPEVIKALVEAAGKHDMGTCGMLSKTKIRLARRLADICPGDLNRVILAGSGADSVECALKLARGATGRKKIISMDKAYHGHAGFSLSANGKPYYKELFEPLMPAFETVPFGDISCLGQAVDKDTAAVILEPIQGEGGIHVADSKYLNDLRKLCDQAGALLIFDEIQTGFCRTGRFWGSEHSGVIPDIMVAAKSMSGGVFPNAAVVYRDTHQLVGFVENHPFFHRSFGGSDLGCAVTLKVIGYLVEHRTWERAAELGNRFLKGLERLKTEHGKVIREIRGRGLMVGIEYTEEFMGVLMADCLAQQQIFAAYSGNAPGVMRFQIPLSADASDIDDLLSGIGAAIRTMKTYLLLLWPLTLVPGGRWLLNEKDILIPINLFLRRFGL